MMIKVEWYLPFFKRLEPAREWMKMTGDIKMMPGQGFPHQLAHIRDDEPEFLSEIEQGYIVIKHDVVVKVKEGIWHP